MLTTPLEILRTTDASHLRMAFLATLVLAPAAWSASLEGTWKISAPQVSFVPEGGSIPFSTQGMEAYARNKAAFARGDYDDYDHVKSRCGSPGLPRVMLTPERFELFQRSHLILMVFEWNRLRRTITLSGLPTQSGDLIGTAGNLVGTAMGTSEGHWEGDTLVVASHNFSQNTLIDELVSHGYDLKITERIRLKNSQTLEDRITVDDPDFFTHSWTSTVTYRRQPTAIIPEDVCLDRLRGPPPLATR
jgi:hypothetical protein